MRMQQKDGDERLEESTGFLTCRSLLTSGKAVLVIKSGVELTNFITGGGTGIGRSEDITKRVKSPTGPNKTNINPWAILGPTLL